MARDWLLRRMRWGRVTLAVAVAVMGLTLSAPAAAWLVTDGAWTRLVQYLLGFVSEPGEFEVRVGRVTNPLSGTVTVDGLSVSDRRGEWLTAERVTLRWRPLALVRGRVEIEELGIARLSLMRLPETERALPGDTTAPADNPFQLPAVPEGLRIDRFTVTDGNLGAAVLGEAATFEASGGMLGAGDRQSLRLEARRTDRPGDRIVLDYLHEEGRRLDIELAAEGASGGLLARALGLDGAEAVSIDLGGAGTPDDWRGRLRAAVGGYLEGGGDVAASWGHEFRVAADGRFTLGARVPAELRRAGSDIRVAVRASTRPDGSATFEQAEVVAPFAHARMVATLPPGHESVSGELALDVTDRESFSALVPGFALADASARLRFDGPLAALVYSLEGEVAAPRFGGMGAARLRLQGESAVTDGTARTLALSLDIDSPDPGDPGLAVLLGERMRAETRGTLDMGRGHLALSRVHAEAAAFALDGALAGNTRDAALEGELTLRLQRLEPLSAFAGMPLAGSAELRLEQLRAGFDGRFRAVASARGQGLVVDGNRLGSVDGAPGGEAFVARASIAFDTERGTLVLDGLDARLAGLMAHGDWETNLSAGTAAGEIVVAAARLDALRPWLDLPAQGGAELRIAARDMEADGTVRGTLALTGQELRLEDSDLAVLLGPGPEATGGFALGRASGLAVEINRVVVRAGVATGRLRFTEGFTGLDGELTLDVPELAALSELAGLDLGGRGRADVHVEGSFDRLRARADLALGALAVEGYAIGEAAGFVTFDGADDGTLGVDLRLTEGPAAPGHVRARVGVGLQGSGTRVDDIDVAAFGGTAAGALSVEANGLVSGDLSFDWSDLATLAPVLDLPAMGGSLEGTARLEGREGGQLMDLAATGSNVVLHDGGTPEGAGAPVVTAGTLEVAATLGPSWTEPLGKVRFDLREGAIVGRGFDSLRGTLAGDLVAPGFEIAVEDARGIGLAARGSANFRSDAWRIELAQLTGAVSGRDVKLMRPLTVIGGPALSAAPLDLRVGEGSVRGRFEQSAAGYVVDLDLDALPAALLEAILPQWEMTGRADGRIMLDTRPTSAAGKVALRLDGVSIEGDVPGDPGLSAVIDGTWDGTRIDARAEVRGVRDAPLLLRLDLPLLARHGAFPGLPEEGDVTGNVSLQGPVAALWDHLPLPDHLLRGDIDARLDLAGTARAPSVTGRVALRRGSYEHLELGTVLRDIELSAATRDGRFLDIVLSGTDGAMGRIQGSGRVELAALTPGGPDLRPEATLTLADVVAVRRDELTARVNGKLVLEDRDGRLTLGGRIVADRVEASLINDLPPSVIELQVTEIGRPGVPVPPPAEREAARPVALDLQLDIPGRMFVRGRGLDSEWKGSLRLQGAEPVRLAGQLEVVRGGFELGGKDFALTRGRVLFDGGAEIDPRLDIVARHDSPTISGTIAVSGTLSDPQLALSSVPGYPQDEVLSRVLFNKGPGALTPLEAVTLADSAATLAGVGGSGGVMRQFRETLGVDVLRVSGTEGEAGAAVTVGKYIADNVFIGATQGSGRDTSAVRVEIGVTDNIKVESDFGAEAGNNVGISWEWRY